MNIDLCERDLAAKPRAWLITGVAGFLGSNLLERLLCLDQTVTGLDNLSTGHRDNLDQVRQRVSPTQWSRFKFIEGDIRQFDVCRDATRSVDYVLHQAALGSVPRSLTDPLATHATNVDGFLNILVASRDANVKRFVYASSSSVYGDHPGLPKVEANTGNPLSPYAATKYFNEIYADVFARSYGLQSIGLRYFNVFGPRQDPEGAYAAVIPCWFKSLIQNEPLYINGDGTTSRDFCFIDNAVQANLLAAWTSSEAAINQVYNVAFGEQTTLSQLYGIIRAEVNKRRPTKNKEPLYREFRAGDVRHSLADISKARRLLGYEPTHDIARGLALSADYYLAALA